VKLREKWGDFPKLDRIGFTEDLPPTGNERNFLCNFLLNKELRTTTILGFESKSKRRTYFKYVKRGYV